MRRRVELREIPHEACLALIVREGPENKQSIDQRRVKYITKIPVGLIVGSGLDCEGGWSYDL